MVNVFEILAMRDEIAPNAKFDWIGAYERGLDLMRRRAFAEAIEYFNRAIDLRDGMDKPSSVMIGRCQEALAEAAQEAAQSGTPVPAPLSAPLQEDADSGLAVVQVVPPVAPVTLPAAVPAATPQTPAPPEAAPLDAAQRQQAIEEAVAKLIGAAE